MELKELTDRTLELFGVTTPEQLGPALLAACGDSDKLRSFRDLVGGDLSTDWMQKIYQYYLADRKEKKQDFYVGQKMGYDKTEIFAYAMETKMGKVKNIIAEEVFNTLMRYYNVYNSRAH